MVTDPVHGEFVNYAALGICNNRGNDAVNTYVTRRRGVRTIVRKINLDDMRISSGAGNKTVHAHVRLPHIPVSIEHEREGPRA